MASTSSEQRRQREAEFHDQAAVDFRPEETLVDETFSAPTAAENQYILEQFGDVAGKRVLDYGCGAGEAGVYLAKLGARVMGIDVSRGMLEATQKLARHHGVDIETRLVEHDVVPAEDHEFDLIYGSGVLHHVDLQHARSELARVLKSTGTGCFIEPLAYNPVIEVYRRLANAVRTEDERPLSFGDIERFRENFGVVLHKEFWLTTLAVFLKFYLVDRVHPNQERYWKKIYTDAESLRWFYEPLRKADKAILERLPWLGRLCWTTVITLRSPL